jgi:hypothetical protein
VPAQSPAAATLDAAQRSFYSGQYEAAAATALALRTSQPDNLAAYELRTSAIHFQIKRLMGEAGDKDAAFKQCASCRALLASFNDDIARGQAAARARLAQAPNDDEAQFFLGKLDLNHVWLQLGTLGNKTGWREYWEARKSMDAILKRNPAHVRAKVARAWIDYIVDTKMTWGFRWLLGGGNKKRALTWLREAAKADTDFVSSAEARFALWDMLVREKNFAEAAGVAKQLAADFPDNKELATFLKAHPPRSSD